MSTAVVNRATIEALVRCGAFDSVHGENARAAVAAAIDEAIAAGQTAAEDRRAGQMSIFGAPEDAGEVAEMPARPLPSVPAWDRMTMLEHEKQTLGFHVSGHPLDEHGPLLAQFCSATVQRIAAMKKDTPVVLGGMLAGVRLTVTRKGRSAGQRMAMITIQDRTGTMDGVVFSGVFAKCGRHLQDGALVTLVGTVDNRHGDPQLIVEDAFPLELAPARLAGTIEVDLGEPAADPQGERMQLVVGLFEQAQHAPPMEGCRAADVIVHMHTDGKRVSMRSQRLRAVADPGLLARLGQVVGPEHVWVKSAGVPKVGRARDRRRGAPEPVGA
jgi:DNA polymerase-3 subunit alpha